MKKTSATPLPGQYERLRRRLAATGYISQGSVLDRSVLRSPRHGCQWTRKVSGKTITVALNQEQFQALGQAIKNHRQLRQTIGKMEALSRRILFKSLPDTRRRKRLNSKDLGLI
jgi:uncharacterized protein DUF6788